MTPLRQAVSAEVAVGLTPQEEALIGAAVEVFVLLRRHGIWPTEAQPDARKALVWKDDGGGRDRMTYEQALALQAKLRRRRLVFA